MTDDQTRLLLTPRRGLEAVRRDRSTWSRLVFRAERTAGGKVVDGNRRTRFGVLWAAQYDRRPDDLSLLRFLLAQEITYYRETVFVYMPKRLELAGLLVAEHRRVEDVWLHWRAKEMSFDTFLGYRTPHLLTAGVAATVAEVRASDQPARDQILRETTRADGTPRFTDAMVDEWLTAQRARFPDDPDAEDLRTWADRAASLGDREASRRFILRWADGQERNGRTLHCLQFHLGQLGFLDEAIRVQTEAVALSPSGWERASALLSLVRLQREAGQFAGAWAALRDCGEVMPTDDFSRGTGLWRSYVKEHFLLVPMAPDGDAALRLQVEGDRQLSGVPRLWMDGVLDAAMAAAEHIGQGKLRDRYAELLAAELAARDAEWRS